MGAYNAIIIYMNSHPKEQLALFGKNRYHDWVVFFFTAVVIIAAGAMYNTWLYFDTQAIIANTNGLQTSASQFDAFKKNVDFVSSYLDGSSSGVTSTIPRDPSLR